MKIKHWVFICLLFCIFLSGCKNTTKADLGLANQAPDEFMVMPRKPLSLPPEFDLRPVSEPQDEENASLSDAEAGLIDQLKGNK